MYKRKYDLISSKFKEFFLPTLFTSMAGNICLFIDKIMVSLLIGTSNFTAVQLVSPVITFTNLIYWMIGLGGSVLASVSKSEFNRKKANLYFTVSIISLVSIGILMMIFGLIFSDSIIHFLCSNNDLIPKVQAFYIIIILGLPFLCYMMSLSYFIRADGLPRLPFEAILLSNVVNIICDILFMSVFNMGVGGAALASVVGYILGSVYISIYFFKSERTFKIISPFKIKTTSFFNYLKKICISGFPSSSTQLFLTVNMFLINSLLIVVSGSSGVLAFGICWNCLYILYMFLIGSAQTMSPIVSVYNNEEDYSGVEYVVKKALKVSFSAAFILMAIFVIYPELLLMVYRVNNPADIPVVVNAIRLFSLSYLGTSVTFTYIFYAQAIENNKLSFIIACVQGFIVPIFGSYTLVNFIGINGIWISFILADIIVILFIFIYSKYLNKKTNGEYSGFFLIKNAKPDSVLDLTINGKVEEAVDLSKEVNEYLNKLKMKEKTSVIVSLAIEEMLVNIIEINEKIDTIDVLIKLQEKNILICIKDQGIEFNPTVEIDAEVNCSFDRVSVLNKIADKIDYERVLGLNDTVITIKN
ncbi:MAG: hypothetical protein HUK28_01200 [Methanobrevibacter sp.]|nr:hypothetical protein [Methanobrevibacter sp.]